MRFRQAAAFVITLLFGLVMCSGCGAETHESSAKQSAVSGSGSSVAASTTAERMDPKPVESSEPTEGTEPLDSCEPTEETDSQLLGLHTLDMLVLRGRRRRSASIWKAARMRKRMPFSVMRPWLMQTAQSCTQSSPREKTGVHPFIRRM